MSRRSLGDDGFAWPVSDADLDAFEIVPVSDDGVARAPRGGPRARPPSRRATGSARRRKPSASPMPEPSRSTESAEAARPKSFLTRTPACASSVGLLDVVPVPIEQCAPLPVAGSLPPCPRTRPTEVNLERSALVATGMVLGVLLALVVSAARDRAPAAGREPVEALERASVTAAVTPRAAPAQPAAVVVRALGTVGPPFAPDAPVAARPDAAPAVVEPAAGAPAPPAEAAAGPSRSPVQPTVAGPTAARRGASARPAPAPAATTRPTTRAAPAVRPPTPPAAFEAVRRYARAYARMDARAVQAVWPSADREELVTTFTSLREQRLTLSRCQAKAADAGAVVTCRGTLRYRPRLGDHSTRVQRGVWSFELRQADEAWRIADVTAP